MPVLSVSLGDTASSAPVAARAVTRREDSSSRSGDVVMLGGEDRLALHGIDRVLAGTSDLLARGRTY